MTYGYIGSMKAQPGRRDEVVAILLEAAQAVPAAGCLSYVVCTDAQDADVVWVSETWPSKQQHDDSLQLPAAKEAIGRAMPMLTNEFFGREVTVVGGLGAPPSS